MARPPNFSRLFVDQQHAAAAIEQFQGGDDAGHPTACNRDLRLPQHGVSRIAPMLGRIAGHVGYIGATSRDQGTQNGHWDTAQTHFEGPPA